MLSVNNRAGAGRASAVPAVFQGFQGSLAFIPIPADGQEKGRCCTQLPGPARPRFGAPPLPMGGDFGGSGGSWRVRPPRSCPAQPGRLLLVTGGEAELGDGRCRWHGDSEGLSIPGLSRGWLGGFWGARGCGARDGMGIGALGVLRASPRGRQKGKEPLVLPLFLSPITIRKPPGCGMDRGVWLDPFFPWDGSGTALGACGAGTNPESRPRRSPGGNFELLWVLLGTAAPSPGRIPSPRIFPMVFFPPLICFEVTWGRSCPLHHPPVTSSVPLLTPLPLFPLSIQAAPPLFPIQRNDPIPFPASQKIRRDFGSFPAALPAPRIPPSRLGTGIWERDVEDEDEERQE